MRAVNLMPGEHRSSRSASRAGASAGAVYLLLAGLAGLAVFAALWTVAGKQINDREATLVRVNAQADAAEKRAAASAPYAAFAKLASDRVATVSSLSATRFDFANGLREVSRVLPADAWLISLKGTTGAANAAPTPTTSAAPAPQFELEGCTLSQAKVARLMARLRAVNGVRDVELRKSIKPDQASPLACPANGPKNPAFTIAISFKVPGAAKDQVDATGHVVKVAAPAAVPPAAGAATPPAAGATAPPASGATAPPAAAPTPVTSTPKAG